MSDRRWARLLLWASASAVVAGLVITALLPGPVDPAVPGPGFGAGPVSAGTPATAAWGDVAGLVPGIDPDSANPCQAGRLECLDLVVAEMEARLELHPCEHTAPFAFTYLEMTRDVRRRVAEPDFFVAPSVMAQLDTLFARLYFEASDNWSSGRRDEVPGAWQLAFQAAEGGRTSAAADVFLGMNAHISRDLAYAVAQVIEADLLEDPTDYLLVNEVIAAVEEPMLIGSAARFDPGLAELASLIPADTGVTSVDLIARWRMQAFELGQRLATADTGEERAAIEAEIERNAVAGAVMILNADSAFSVDDTQFDRDEYCESHR